MVDAEGTHDENLNNIDSSDIKQLEKHYQQLIGGCITRAKLPKVYGWTSQVMMSLIWRLGKTPLEVSLIAEELELPMRTLQYHLSQEGTSFTVLRDQVRFHYSIRLLVEGKRIEEIYPMLGFSDRAGLINAFKRWTGLPPHHFRKLYNVYVRPQK